jgi:hypothetical protein
MKTSGGRRQTPVLPFHAGKGFHDGTSDGLGVPAPPPHHQHQSPLTSGHTLAGVLTCGYAAAARWGRCVCVTPLPPPAPLTSVKGARNGPLQDAE